MDKERLVQALQARLGTTDVQMLVDLLEASLEECKAQLVRCDESQLIRAQEEARTYAKLLKLLTRPRLKDITQE